VGKDTQSAGTVESKGDSGDDGAPSFLRTLPADRYGEFRPAGEGGMGIVYWAIDTDLNREVAFKVIRPERSDGSTDVPDRPSDLSPPREDSGNGRSFRALKQRFLQEAWITSSMAHPGIVPVYELGQTPEGVPYYTMRFIGGDRTLATAIREVRDRDIEERLSLLEPFLKVCDAVRYAHSCGVLHRDLKPKNIALGDFGEVVLLDWGLAKFKGAPDPETDHRLRSRLTEYRAARDMATVAGALGTPGYMGPEAVRGDGDVMDERSDVYSLGAMLFEILTGRLPFEFESFGELATKLLGEEAPRARDVDPSVPKTLSELSGACLARAMDGRPPSVDEITDAVRTWQVERECERKVAAMAHEADLEIAAAREAEGRDRMGHLDRAVAASGRLRRLRPGDARIEEFDLAIARLRERGIRERDRATRRRLLKRVGVIGLAVATAATVLAAVLIDGQRRDAELARSRETEQRARAEDLAAYMLGDLRDELQPLGRLDLLRKVASKSLEYYEDSPAEALTANDRHARGLALGNIGDVLQDSGEMGAAEKLYLESVEILKGLVAGDPSNRVWQRDLSVGRNRLGDVRQETGNLRSALALYREALASRRSLADAAPDDLLAQDDIARTVERVGDVLIRLGDREPATEAFGEGLAIRRRLVADAPGESKWWDALATSLVKVGDTRTKTGDLPAALECYDDAHEILTQLISETPRSSTRREALAGCVFRIGYVREEKGDRAAALARYRQSLAIYRGLGAGDPNHAWWQRNIALSLDRVADLLEETGDRDTVLEHYREAQEIRRAIHEKDAGNTRAAHDLSASHVKVGDFAKAAKDLAAARKSYEEALSIGRRLAADEPENTDWQTDIAHVLNRLGSLTKLEGNAEVATKHYREATAILRRLSEKDPSQTEIRRSLGQNLLSLGDLARDGKDLTAAGDIYRETLDISRRLSASDASNRSWQTDLVTALNRTAALAGRTDDSTTALACHEEATEVNRRLLATRPDDSLRRRDLSYNLYYAGVLHEAAGHIPEALAALREGESLHRDAMTRDRTHAAEHHWWTAAYRRVVLSAGEERLETVGDHLALAYALHAKKEYAAATRQFAKALDDASIREDLIRGNLYNGACAAALAGLGEQAMSWLTEDLRFRRASLAAVEIDLLEETEEAKRKSLESRANAALAHFEHAREKDPDLESLRSRAAFAALFE